MWSLNVFVVFFFFKCIYRKDLYIGNGITFQRGVFSLIPGVKKSAPVSLYMVLLPSARITGRYHHTYRSLFQVLLDHADKLCKSELCFAFTTT